MKKMGGPGHRFGLLLFGYTAKTDSQLWYLLGCLLHQSGC